MKDPPRQRPTRGLAKAPVISVAVEEPRWREHKSALRLIRRAARLVLEDKIATPAHLGSKLVLPALTILLTDNARLKALNASFRGKDKPTNVLSFPPPAAERSYLGDIAIAYGVVSREARVQKKDFADHAAHLAVHGILHLLGLNHEKMREARVMETCEVHILAKLGISNPYAPRAPGSRAYTRAGKAA